jgi:hypothetical protein
MAKTTYKSALFCPMTEIKYRGDKRSFDASGAQTLAVMANGVLTGAMPSCLSKDTGLLNIDTPPIDQKEICRQILQKIYKINGLVIETKRKQSQGNPSETCLMDPTHIHSEPKNSKVCSGCPTNVICNTCHTL